VTGSKKGDVMGDTYETAAEAEADRAQQRAMLTTLSASDRALRRDECGAWRIAGTRGAIHTWGDGKSWVRHWIWLKRKLGFCQVTQDGDGEGCLRLHQLPTPDQAAVIRDVLGIPKRREVSAAELGAIEDLHMASIGSRVVRQLGAPGLANAASWYTRVTSDREPKFRLKCRRTPPSEPRRSRDHFSLL
jgi:hypothetical protein